MSRQAHSMLNLCFSTFKLNLVHSSIFQLFSDNENTIPAISPCHLARLTQCLKSLLKTKSPSRPKPMGEGQYFTNAAMLTFFHWISDTIYYNRVRWKRLTVNYDAYLIFRREKKLLLSFPKATYTKSQTSSLMGCACKTINHRAWRFTYVNHKSYRTAIDALDWLTYKGVI